MLIVIMWAVPSRTVGLCLSPCELTVEDHMMYTNLLALSPKDYCLIPGNGTIKLDVI